ncbi:MAG: hypothetical protein HC921_18305 [Synechococcaceae cyanobacterium SM2_3_1]|nr:hypothetical protein [Synechococcaceae cyanobacterium SM2_3_1]
MLVTAESPLAITGTAVEFGEIFTVVNSGASATTLNSRGVLPITTEDFHPEKVQIQRQTNILPSFSFPEVNTGATLSNVTGVVSYAFGNYEILPTEEFTASNSSLTPETTTLNGGSDQLLIATYNVLNLDPVVETGVSQNDIDDDLGDGRFAAIASQIANNLNSPDIICLQEVQDNDGAQNNGVTAANVTLQTLVDAISSASGPDYEFIDNPGVSNNLGGGQPGGNIRTALLYNPQRVDLVGNSVQSITEAGAPTTSPTVFFEGRPPLRAQFSFNSQPVDLVCNHFSSKSGSAAILGVEQPFEDLQEDPNINGSLDQRQAQAAAVNTFVSNLLSNAPDANVVVLGDLNEFEFVSPVLNLAIPGLTNLIDTLPPSERYSFIFQGNAQQIDHILVTNNLVSGAQVDNVHVNVEFVNNDQRASDHDPVLASLNLPPVSGGPTDLNVGDVQILGYRSEGQSLFAFVLWTDVTAGTSISFTDDSITSTGEFRNGTQFPPNETLLTWTATTDLPAGTVVVINGSTRATDAGQVTGILNALSPDGDQIFAFQGAKDPTNLLFGFNFGNGGWITTGTANQTLSYLPSILNVTDGNIDAGAVSLENNGQYIGSRSNQTTVDGYQAQIYTGNLPVLSNWTFSPNGLTLDSTDFSGL